MGDLHSRVRAEGFDVHISQQAEGSPMLAAPLDSRNLLVNIVAALDGEGSAVTLTHLAPPE